MGTIKNAFITEDIELTNKVIDYFLAEIINQARFEEIKLKAIEFTSISERPYCEGLIKTGFLSIKDCMMYLSATEQISGGIKTTVIEILCQKFVDENILVTPPEFLGKTNHQRYRAGGEFAKYLYDRNLILNLVCGWSYIINTFSGSVLKIEHENDKGDKSMGTGYYFAAKNGKIEKHIIITNKHVLEKASSIRVLTKDDNEIKYRTTKLDIKRDLGYIELTEALNLPILHFNPGRELLSEILTIGYPSIPMTKQSYQVYHKGELNSFVEDYNGNQLFLFSAKTSSGNSGSPIIDRYGMVIGIVTEELFEQNEFYEKGKLPYYAGIPSEEIIKSLNEFVF